MIDNDIQFVTIFQYNLLIKQKWKERIQLIRVNKRLFLEHSVVELQGYERSKQIIKKEKAGVSVIKM